MIRWFRSHADDIDMAQVVKEYRLDLERFTFLRDKAIDQDEIDQYQIIIDVAQKTLISLLEMHAATQEMKHVRIPGTRQKRRADQ